MAITVHGLRTVIYPVTDVEAATQWWTQLLGYDPYFREAFYVGFEVGGYELGLLPDANVSSGALTYWGVDDVQFAVDEAVSAGATIHVAPSEVGGEIVTATVVIPDGSIVGFIYNPHFATA